MSIFKKYPENKQNDEGKEFEEVYAGPEVMESHFDKPQFSKVYAGPDSYKKPNPKSFAGVYAGPKQMNRIKVEEDVICKCVYAGPEKIDKPPKAVESIEEPELQLNPNQPFDSAQFMCVYAGPEQMSGNYTPIGVAVNVDKTPSKYCPNCGMKISETDKFCTNCGEKVNCDD